MSVISALNGPYWTIQRDHPDKLMIASNFAEERLDESSRKVLGFFLCRNFLEKLGQT